MDKVNYLMRNLSKVPKLNILYLVIQLLSVISFLLSGYGILKSDSQSTKSYYYTVALILSGGVFLLLVSSWFFLFIQEYRYSLKARYAESTSLYHNVLHDIRDINDLLIKKNINQDNKVLNDSDIKLIKIKLEKALSSVASIFSLVTGVKCRACLKEISYDGDTSEHNMASPRNTYVETFCRSDGRKPEDSGIFEKDWIDKNTDFYELFYWDNGLKNYFSHGNLPALKGYINSHIKPDTKRKDYPYISTIVLPIRYCDPDNEGSELAIDVRGFLCIDSKARHAFCERYDISYGAGIADALYPILKLYFYALTTQKAIDNNN